MNIGDRIKNIRLLYKLKLEDFAKILDVHPTTVSNWENNTYVPETDTIIKMAKEFKITSDYILTLDDRLFLNVDGLTDEQIIHLQLVADDISNK